MKPLLNSLILLLLASTSNAQIVNGGFEDWSDGKPVGWTRNPIYGIPIETNNAHTGSKAVALFATEYIQNSAVQQELYDMHTSGQNSLNFYLSVHGTSLHALFRVVVKYQSNGFTEKFVTMDLEESPEYKLITLDWQDSPRNTDTISIDFIVAGLGGKNGNGWLEIDDVSLSGVTPLNVVENGSVSHPCAPQLVSLYPNPFNGNASIKYLAQNGAIMRLFDGRGRFLNQVIAPPSGQITWRELGGSTMSAGHNIIVLESDAGVVSTPAIYLR